MYKCQKRIMLWILIMLTLTVSTNVYAQIVNQRHLDYIGGPWIYTSVPCGNLDCEHIDSLNIDFLSRYTDKKATEINFAKGNSKPEEILFLGGRLTWHSGFLGGRGEIFTDNVGDLVGSVNLNPEGYSNAVFYGLIVLKTNAASESIMQLGYSAYAKVWLNGEVVYESENRMWHDASEMKKRFSVPIKKGKNLLMTKVVEGIGWNLFTNIHTNFTVSYRMKDGKIFHDEILSVEPSDSTVSTRWASLKRENRF